MYIASYALAPVVKRSSATLMELITDVAQRCLHGFDRLHLDAVLIGNMLAGSGSSQRLLGSMVAAAIGHAEAEAVRIEAACGSGGSVIRHGYLSVLSGQCRNVLVIGAELMSPIDKADIGRHLATASDWSKEGSRGSNFITLNSGLMAEYVRRHRLDPDRFSVFPVVAHDHAFTADHALYRRQIDDAAYAAARVIHGVLRLYDASPVCDGCAAALLTSDEGLARGAASGPIATIIGSASASDHVALADRGDALEMPAIAASTRKSLISAGVALDDLDFFEPHDAYSIMTALSIESAGFAKPGTAAAFARDVGIGTAGSLPMMTMGGLKARGHAVGASGVYQMVEACMQLTGTAGANQVRDAEIGMIQNIGGCGAAVTTHILARA